VLPDPIFEDLCVNPSVDQFVTHETTEIGEITMRSRVRRGHVQNVTRVHLPNPIAHEHKRLGAQQSLRIQMAVTMHDGTPQQPGMVRQLKA
jgi:hypothetical protein